MTKSGTRMVTEAGAGLAGHADKKHNRRLTMSDGGAGQTFSPIATWLLEGAHVVALADFHTVVAQQVIRGGDVEEELWQRVVHHI